MISTSLKIPALAKGEIYAGLTLQAGVPVALVLLPGDAGALKWEQAKAWAKDQGGELPSRIDALVLIQNLKSEFREEWYWTGEEYARGADYAWSQSFYGGVQSSDHKSSYGRARAVRRVAI